MHDNKKRHQLHYRSDQTTSNDSYSRPNLLKCKCKSNEQWKFVPRPKNIPQKTVLGLFNLHNNRTPPKHFDRFIPLYPKTSSFLIDNYLAPHPSANVLEECPPIPDKKLLVKVFTVCRDELEAFNDLNRMNDHPMIEEEHENVRQGGVKWLLFEDVLLFLTNLRIRDILGLKKREYLLPTDEYFSGGPKVSASFSEEEVEVEVLYPAERDISSSSSSSTFESCGEDTITL